MTDHVRILAVLNIVFGALGLIGALVVLLIFGGVAGIIGSTVHDPDAQIAIPIIGVLGAGIVVLLLVVSLPGIIAGVGLLKFQPWARMIAIVLSALNIMNVPFGTLLGIYGLWVLLHRETERLFSAQSTA